MTSRHEDPRTHLGSEALISTWTALGQRLEVALDSRGTEDIDLLFKQLLELGRVLLVPVDDARDDTHVFIESPSRLATATFAQCGGCLQALAKHSQLANARVVRGIISRIAELARTHRGGV